MNSNAKKCHVMHVVESLEVGGMENGVVNLANLIDKNRFTFSICCLSRPGNLCKRLEDDRIEVISLNWRGGFSPKLFFELARVLNERKVDVVHTHGWLTLLYGSVASVILGRRPLINGEHGTFHLDSFRRRMAYRAISQLVNKYVAVSFSLENKLGKMIRAGRNKIICIPNGVDVRKFCPRCEEDVAELKSSFGIPASSIIIGSVGRLEPVKNYEMLLRVFARLSVDDARLHCVLIGDGSQRANLENLALQLGIKEKVHFTGKVDNPHHVMSILDLFISSSLSEGMSNTILEATACGIPIVATDVGDSGKLVEDGRNGFMVQSEDDHSLEEAIKRLTYDTGMRQRFGARSRAIAEEKFDIMKMVNRYQDVYLQSVVNKRVAYDL